ncbi:MAG: ferrochelatase, partial [Vicinamibacterales bacterium]
MPSSFDAVLLIAFGGPGGRDDIRPFLANVLRGRRVAPERVEDVVHHYEIFDGVSPITELTMRQARALREALAAAGAGVPVYVGMRNWHPYLRDTLAQMSRDGVRRAVGVIDAAHRSYSSCTQYRENVADARRALREAGLADVEITYVDDWHLAPGFIEANADHVLAAVGSLPEEVRGDAQLVFTAHSIPVSMAQRYPYQRQLEESCAAVAAEVTSRTPHPAPRISHPA